MKKSEQYRVAALAVLAMEELNNEDKLDIVRALMNHEALEEWREEHDS